MSKGSIIDHTWYSPGLGNMPVPYVVTVGIVLVHYPDERYVQAYLGLGSGRDLEQDIADIAAWGAKLEPEVARAHFPNNDIPYKGEVEHA